jgi:hypothetical protein
MKKRAVNKPQTTGAQSEQLQRFKEMAKELGADESPQALDRAFARLDTKKKEVEKPAKQRAKAKNHGAL